MQATDEPLVAPDAVVEVKSAGDRELDLAEKVRVYLTAGTRVVFVVDTKARTVTVCDATGKRLLSGKHVITHRALPRFRLAVKTLFEMPRPK